MIERRNRIEHGGICATVITSKDILSLEEGYFTASPHLADLNVILAISSQLVTMMLDSKHGEVVLTASRSEGAIKVFADGHRINTGKYGVTESGLGFAIQARNPLTINSTEKAEGIAKKMVWEKKAVLLKVAPAAKS